MPAKSAQGCLSMAVAEVWLSRRPCHPCVLNENKRAFGLLLLFCKLDFIHLQALYEERLVARGSAWFQPQAPAGARPDTLPAQWGCCSIHRLWLSVLCIWNSSGSQLRPKDASDNCAWILCMVLRLQGQLQKAFM